MRIVKIERENGNYKDAEENTFDLVAVLDSDALATNKTVNTNYDSLAEYISGENITLIGEIS